MFFVIRIICAPSCFILFQTILRLLEKLAQKEYQTRHDWVGKVISWEICRKFQFDHTNKWYMHNPTPVLENVSHKLLWDFNIKTDHLIPARRQDLNKKTRICKIVDFAVPADHRINLKESEKKDKYLNLARGKIKKLWNMKVTIVPIGIVALGTLTKGLLKGLGDGWRLSKRQHCWGRPEYWDECWRLEETCSHSNSSEKPSANTDVKNSKGVKIMIITIIINECSRLAQKEY